MLDFFKRKDDAVAISDEKPKTERERLASERARTEEEKAALEAERVYAEGVTSVRDLIAPASLHVDSRYLELGSKFVSTLFVISYPRHIAVGWFESIINLNVPLDIGMFFYPVKTEVILKQLKKKVGEVEAQIYSDAEKGAPRDPLAETALRDIESLRDNLTQGTEKFFQHALYVTVYSDTKEDLTVLTEKVESIFGSKLVYSKRVYYQAEQGFNSTLPLGNDELYIAFNMNSSPAAASFPFMSSELTSDKGILYGINQHNNSLILFDRFSLQNANMVVFATAGAGKSYAVKLEILRSMMLGTDVIVIDPENEYKYLSDAVGGTFINVSLNSQSKLNPFDLPRPYDAQMTTADIIRSAVIVLKGLLRIMLGKLTPEEDSLLDRALIETYAKKDITGDADLRQIEPPVLSDLQQILEGMTDTKSLVARLKKYTEGTFEGLFNNFTNVDLDNQLVVFSVRDLEDELRPMGIYMIMNYVWNIIRSEKKQRIMAIDEAWWLMRHDDSAKFLNALVKRCRKYYMGVTTITQDVSDFLHSAYGNQIITNSELKLLLKQSTAGIDTVAKTFLLTQGERYVLLNARQGDGLFFAGEKHAYMHVEASYYEDKIITSDPRQILEIEQAKKEFAEQYGEEA